MVSIVKTVKNTERLRQIVTVLVKHGFGELVARTDLRALVPGHKPDPDKARRDGERFAVRLRLAMQELGPSFVKLGQIVSTRADLIPPEIIAELEKLQDDVPPMSAADVDELLAASFSAEEAAALFSSLDTEPLASASIGQVHCARLRTEDEGELDVVVKLQRPRIRGLIESDLDLLYLLARLIERHIPESRVYSPLALVTEFDRAIMAELDFTLEADNAAKFARNFDGDPTVRFPRVHRQASGKRVLTMERFVGAKIYEFVGDDREVGARVARRALHVVARMIFEHGFFHADPHPGNIIILGTPEEPVIGLIDLGLVGRLTPEMRDRAIRLMIAAVTGDPDALADALLTLGRPRGRVDMEAFRAEVTVLSEKYLGKPLAEVELSALVRDLVQGAVKYDIEMPAEMMMVGKALMTVEGIGKDIDPDLDVWTELRPYLLRLLWNRYRPERLGRDLLRGISRLGTSAARLPGTIDDILGDLRAGRLEVRARDPDAALAGDRLGRRIFAAVLAGALVLSGTTLLAVARHPTVAWLFLSLAALVSVVHLWGDWRRRPPT
jgi:ubiquinone biosynthesis protein